jgi:hypothetical protein
MVMRQISMLRCHTCNVELQVICVVKCFHFFDFDVIRAPL